MSVKSGGFIVILRSKYVSSGKHKYEYVFATNSVTDLKNYQFEGIPIKQEIGIAIEEFSFWLHFKIIRIKEILKIKRR